jgi:hypothetical protein
MQPCCALLAGLPEGALCWVQVSVECRLQSDDSSDVWDGLSGEESRQGPLVDSCLESETTVRPAVNFRRGVDSSNDERCDAYIFGSACPIRPRRVGSARGETRDGLFIPAWHTSHGGRSQTKSLPTDSTATGCARLPPIKIIHSASAIAHVHRFGVYWCYTAQGDLYAVLRRVPRSGTP